MDDNTYNPSELSHTQQRHTSTHVGQVWCVVVYVSEHILHTRRYEVLNEQWEEAYSDQKAHLKVSEIGQH